LPSSGGSIESAVSRFDLSLAPPIVLEAGRINAQLSEANSRFTSGAKNVALDGSLLVGDTVPGSFAGMLLVFVESLSGDGAISLNNFSLELRREIEGELLTFNEEVQKRVLFDNTNTQLSALSIESLDADGVTSENLREEDWQRLAGELAHISLLGDVETFMGKVEGAMLEGNSFSDVGEIELLRSLSLDDFLAVWRQLPPGTQEVMMGLATGMLSARQVVEESFEKSAGNEEEVRNRQQLHLQEFGQDLLVVLRAKGASGAAPSVSVNEIGIVDETIVDETIVDGTTVYFTLPDIKAAFTKVTREFAMISRSAASITRVAESIGVDSSKSAWEINQIYGLANVIIPDGLEGEVSHLLLQGAWKSISKKSAALLEWYLLDGKSIEEISEHLNEQPVKLSSRQGGIIEIAALLPGEVQRLIEEAVRDLRAKIVVTAVVEEDSQDALFKAWESDDTAAEADTLKGYLNEAEVEALKMMLASHLESLTGTGADTDAMLSRLEEESALGLLDKAFSYMSEDSQKLWLTYIVANTDLDLAVGQYQPLPKKPEIQARLARLHPEVSPLHLSDLIEGGYSFLLGALHGKSGYQLRYETRLGIAWYSQRSGEGLDDTGREAAAWDNEALKGLAAVLGLEQIHESEALLPRLEESLASLKQSDQMLLAWHLLAGKSYAEIVQLLGSKGQDTGVDKKTENDVSEDLTEAIAELRSSFQSKVTLDHTRSLYPEIFNLPLPTAEQSYTAYFKEASIREALIERLIQQADKYDPSAVTEEALAEAFILLRPRQKLLLKYDVMLSMKKREHKDDSERLKMLRNTLVRPDVLEDMKVTQIEEELDLAMNVIQQFLMGWDVSQIQLRNVTFDHFLALSVISAGDHGFKRLVPGISKQEDLKGAPWFSREVLGLANLIAPQGLEALITNEILHASWQALDETSTALLEWYLIDGSSFQKISEHLSRGSVRVKRESEAEYAIGALSPENVQAIVGEAIEQLRREIDSRIAGGEGTTAEALEDQTDPFQEAVAGMVWSEVEGRLVDAPRDFPALTFERYETRRLATSIDESRKVGQPLLAENILSLANLIVSQGQEAFITNQVLKNSWDSLDEISTALLEWHLFDGKSFAEISEYLNEKSVRIRSKQAGVIKMKGYSPEAVQNIIEGALQKLRSKIESVVAEEGGAAPLVPNTSPSGDEVFDALAENTELDEVDLDGSTLDGIVAATEAESGRWLETGNHIDSFSSEEKSFVNRVFLAELEELKEAGEFTEKEYQRALANLNEELALNKAFATLSLEELNAWVFYVKFSMELGLTGELTQPLLAKIHEYMLGEGELSQEMGAATLENPNEAFHSIAYVIFHSREYMLRSLAGLSDLQIELLKGFTEEEVDFGASYEGRDNKRSFPSKIAGERPVVEPPENWFLDDLEGLAYLVQLRSKDEVATASAEFLHLAVEMLSLEDRYLLELHLLAGMSLSLISENTQMGAINISMNGGALQPIAPLTASEVESRLESVIIQLGSYLAENNGLQAGVLDQYLSTDELAEFRLLVLDMGTTALNTDQHGNVLDNTSEYRTKDP